MPRNCFVPGCKGKGGFVFPAARDQRLRWVEALNVSHLADRTIDKCTVCPRHFNKNDYVSCDENFYTGLPVVRKRLKLSAVPSVDLVLDLESGVDHEIENEDPDNGWCNAAASLQDHDYNFKVDENSDSTMIKLEEKAPEQEIESFQVLESNVINIEINDENIDKILELYNLEDDKLNYSQAVDNLGEQTIVISLNTPPERKSDQSFEEIEATTTEEKYDIERSPKIEKVKSLSGGRVCCIKGCENRVRKLNSSVKYYNFPTDKFVWRNERRKRWIEAVIRHNNLPSDWQPKKYTTICSAHFVGGKKNEHPMHPGYNPTIFPEIHAQAINLEEGSSERFEKYTQKIEQETKAYESPIKSTLNKKVIQKAVLADGTVQRRTMQKIVKPQFIRIGNFYEIREKSTEDFQCQVDFLNCGPMNENRAGCMECKRKFENNLNCAEVQVFLPKDTKKLSAKPRITQNIPVGTLVGKNFMKKMKANSESLKRKTFLQEDSSEEIKFCGISSISSDNDLKCMCGITFDIFNELLKNLPLTTLMGNLSLANQLLMFLMKLKLGYSNTTLSVIFNQPEEAVAKNFNDTLSTLVDFFKNKVCWPSKEAIENTIPDVFKNTYSNCKAMVEFIEMPMEIPENPADELLLYSTYKNCLSFKLLFACAPSGFIIYKSKCYYGQTNDMDIMRDCEFFQEFIETNDVILADKEFPSIRYMLESKNAFFKVPPLVQNVQPTSVHIHIKQCVNRVKFFKILTSVPVDLFSKIDDIIYVCCSIINLQTPLIEEN